MNTNGFKPLITIPCVAIVDANGQTHTTPIQTRLEMPHNADVAGWCISTISSCCAHPDFKMQRVVCIHDDGEVIELAFAEAKAWGVWGRYHRTSGGRYERVDAVRNEFVDGALKCVARGVDVCPFLPPFLSVDWVAVGEEVARVV